MEIHLWTIDVSQNSRRISQNRSLNELEIARANRFKYPELGEKWAFFRQALREILAQHLSQQAKKIEFETNENGKPWLKNSKNEKNIFFNLSHSGSRAIVAVTSLCEIGVDVEKQKKVAELDAIANRFFSQSEQKALASLPSSQRQAAFFRIWTRKEALIKANGLGMSMPLDKFNVPISTLKDWVELEINNRCAKNGHYYLYDVMINGEYDAALCLYSDDLKIEERPQLLYYEYQAIDF